MSGISHLKEHHIFESTYLIKSIKHLFQIHISSTKITFDEATTIVLCQIEACLNSKQLIPLNALDHNGTSVFTPGHFHIRHSLVQILFITQQKVTCVSLC